MTGVVMSYPNHVVCYHYVRLPLVTMDCDVCSEVNASLSCVRIVLVGLYDDDLSWVIIVGRSLH